MQETSVRASAFRARILQALGNLPRGTVVSVALGAVALLALLGSLGLGASQQSQLRSTAESIADSARVIVQLQRETLRLEVLVRQDAASFDPKAAQLQIDLLKSRFDVVRQPLTRSLIPPEILPSVAQIEAHWAQMQPLIKQWQANPRDAKTQASLGQGLQDLEFLMNSTEIAYSRQRTNALDGIYQTSQQWFLFLGIAALLVIVSVIVSFLNLYRATQQRQVAETAHAAALESNRLKSEFLATMSHELRTPLNGVIGYADFLLTAMSGDFNEKVLDYLRRILSNGERLLRLVDEILDLSRIEAGRMEIVNAPFAPSDLLDRVRPEMQTQAGKKGIEFRTLIDPQLPAHLVGDRERLTQVILNLAGNAIKFTETGYVEVRLASNESAHWQIVVTDTGIGIPLHAQEYVFDKFRQVDGTSERKQGGAGLGLAIVRNLALLMNGKVSLDSKSGQGSTFTVELPLLMAGPIRAGEGEHGH